jgi:hypothetical protein
MAQQMLNEPCGSMLECVDPESVDSKFLHAPLREAKTVLCQKKKGYSSKMHSIIKCKIDPVPYHTAHFSVSATTSGCL